ncbi:MAG: M13 family metallopeptidase N-terminal domain-containing protein, partial [Myxococcota bacterium]
MKRPFLALLVLGVACAKAPTQAPAEATAPKLETKAELGAWGIDLSAKKESVKPGDDFFTYANGAWLDSYTLKDDQLRFGSFIALRDRSDERVRAIIDELAGTDPAPGSLEQKIGDAYVSWMDGATLNEKGLAPIQDDLDRFAAIKTKEDVIAAFGWGRRVQSAAPIGWYISTDRKLPDRRLVTVTQSGLGLPDKSYYAGDDERFTAIRAAYVENIAAFLVKSGMEEVKANAAAKEVLALETRLAAVHWERAELRNRDKTYNPFTLEELATEFTGFDWNTVFAEGGLSLADIKK